jgi:hypothetical protein
MLTDLVTRHKALASKLGQTSPEIIQKAEEDLGSLPLLESRRN